MSPLPERLAATTSSAKSDWGTPHAEFQRWDRVFSFTVDAAASKHNRKVLCYWGPDHWDPARRCGLTASWAGERVWCNPPYGRRDTRAWVEKACQREADVAVLLLPSRTSNGWFHDLLWGQPHIWIHYIRGRLTFEGADHGAPFPSLVAVILGRNEDER